MKYLKTYESKKIYNKGDIVLLISGSGLDQFLLPYAKIIRRNTGKPKDRYIDRYYVEILFPNTEHWSYFSSEDIHTTFIVNYSIIRKITKEEKEEIELKIKSDKYNL